MPTVAHRFGLGKPFVSGGWVLARHGSAARSCVGAGASSRDPGAQDLRRAIDSLRRLPRAAVVLRSRRRSSTPSSGWSSRRRSRCRTRRVTSSTRSTWRRRARSRTTTTHTRSPTSCRPLLVALRFGELIGRPDERSVPAEYYDSAVDAVVADPPNPANGRGIDRELESAAAVLRGGGCRVPGFAVAGSAASALVDAPRERALCRADHSVHVSLPPRGPCGAVDLDRWGAGGCRSSHCSDSSPAESIRTLCSSPLRPRSSSRSRARFAGG